MRLYLASIVRRIVSAGSIVFSSVAVLLTVLPQSSSAQANPFACILPAKTGEHVYTLQDWPGQGVLIGTQKGWSLARIASESIRIDSVAGDNTGYWPTARQISNDKTIIGTTFGLFVAQLKAGSLRVQPAENASIGSFNSFHDFKDGIVIIDAKEGLFSAQLVDERLDISRVGGDDVGDFRYFHELAGGNLLIRSSNGLFAVQIANGEVKTKTVGGADVNGANVLWSESLPEGGVLIRTLKDWFLARNANGLISVEKTAGKDGDPGAIFNTRKFPGGGILFNASNGWYSARILNGLVMIQREARVDIGTTFGTYPLPSGNFLIRSSLGLFLARNSYGSWLIERVDKTADMGRIDQALSLPTGGVLVVAEKGLFLARFLFGSVTFERVDTSATGQVYRMTSFLWDSLLLQTDEGWILARSVNGSVRLDRVADKTDLISIRNIHEFPGIGVLVGSEEGLFIVIQKPLSGARMELPDRSYLDGMSIGAAKETTVRISLAHDCAPVADKLNLRVKVMSPGKSEPIYTPPLSVIPGPTAEIRFPLRVNKPGQWTVQLVSTFGGLERFVGEAQTLNFSDDSWLERWWKLLASGLTAAIVLTNVALFFFARYSAWAWRLATDDGWNTSVLRVGTLLLSHFPRAQLWILDFYFRDVRAQLKSPHPFLSVPMTGSDGSIRTAVEVLAPPWAGRRTWVQGASGMGKTALFREVTESHFRTHKTAFSAYAKWGCVLVNFAARDFAGNGENEDDPVWVVDAVRSTLASAGLTFSSAILLSRFLESGTIGVGIDGLDEVDRTRAVAAFARAFKEAPMLVTSQQGGSDRFSNWRLPADIRDFATDLLEQYLPKPEARAVAQRITASGLKDAIRSGYDVLLIIDLARADPHHTVLPANRIELYAAVINAGWPEVPKQIREEQQSLTAAAAWNMVSGRRANEDMRRLNPDVDLPADLLLALADAPDRYNRPVRLIRRVGGGTFEFVHDQMHAYLAARWFAQPGLSVAELEKMVAGSTIWTQTLEARRTLWSFVAALLDDERLNALEVRIEDKEEWDVLRRALLAETRRRKSSAPVEV